MPSIGRGAGGFSPLSLFANGEQGAWFDPGDLSSMYQDAAGTTPAAYGQPVGLILDKSGNGNHAAQATATARPTLMQDSGGRAYMQFDGVDDFFPMGGVELGGKRWYLGVSYAEPPTAMLLLGNASGSNNPWVYAAQQGSSSPAVNAAEAAVSGVWHDNSPSTATTRNQRYLEAQPASVVGVDFTTSVAWQARYGVYVTQPFSVPLRTYSIILREGDLSADHRTELTIWQAHRAGKAL